MFKEEINRAIQEFLPVLEKLKNSAVDLELEARMVIPSVPRFCGVERTITYFRSPDFPTLTIRSPDTSSVKIETKELVKKRVVQNVTFALSVEKSYTRYSFKHPLVMANIRTIRRERIQDKPIIDITEENGIFTVEIEFDFSNYYNVADIIESYRIPFWPSTKPKETHTSEILDAISKSSLKGCISAKADGVHVLLYCLGQEIVAIDDSGKIINLSRSLVISRDNDLLSLQSKDNPSLSDLQSDNNIFIKAENIYEAEMMDNDQILVFDCMRNNNDCVERLCYNERLRLVDVDKYRISIKPIHEFDNFNQFCKSIVAAQNDDIASDGVVLTGLGPRSSNVFKSKEKPTVDMLYSKGYLFLSSERTSTRVCKDLNYPFVEGCIYEFSLDLTPIKLRKDKITPNYYIPPEVDPLTRIAKTEGIPCLRYHHNRIKQQLLQKLPKGSTLIDIGSGKGGDIKKWESLQFSKVYAVDPKLELKTVPKNVIPIKDYVNNIPSVEFDCVSIFYVPWDDIFLDLVKKAKHFVLATMDKPQTYKCKSFECDVNQNEVKLHIPNMSMSDEGQIMMYNLDIQENIIDIKKTIKYLNEEGWVFEKLECSPSFASYDEIVLSKMYSYYYFYKKVRDLL